MTTPKAQQRLCLRLGEAITNWQIVETTLASVFVASIYDAEAAVARAAFYAVIAFNSKLAMTNAAVITAKPEKDLLAKWTDNLHGRLSEEAKRRNHLAHYPMAEEMRLGHPRTRFILSPMLGKPGHTKPPPLYTEKQVRDKRDDFLRLARDVHRFAKTLHEDLELR